MRCFPDRILRRLVLPWFPLLRNTQLLLQWALSGSVLILLVLALRAVLKGRVSRRVQYALWGIVLARLLFPFQLSFSLPWSAASLIPGSLPSWEGYTIPISSSPGGQSEREGVPDAARKPDQAAEPAGGSPERRSAEEAQTSQTGLFSVDDALQSVWWVGGLTVCAVFLLSNFRFHVWLKRRRQRLEIPGCPIPVYVVDGAPSPFLYGLFRPAVYFTPDAAALPAEAQRHVLTHELTHFAHRDHIWAALRCLCLGLHWYHPLVWLAAFLSRRDGELACDEGAVARLGADSRFSYGRTLVWMVARQALRPRDLLSCTTAMAGGKKTIQKRVETLIQQPHTSRAALIFTMLAVATVLLFTFASPPSSSAADDIQFLTRINAARSIRYDYPIYYSSFYPGSITDPDLLSEAKTVLKRAGRLPEFTEPPSWLEDTDRIWLHAAYLTLWDPSLKKAVRYTLHHQDGTTYVLLPQPAEELIPSEYLLVGALDQEISAPLTEFIIQQEERHMAYVSWGDNCSPVDYPQFRNDLTSLLLNHPDAMVLNSCKGMKEWLTNRVTSYHISNGTDSKAAWIRATDGTNWMTLSVPEELEDPIQKICGYQREYLPRESFDLRSAKEVSYRPSPQESRIPVEPALYEEIHNLLTENLQVLGTPIIQMDGRHSDGRLDVILSDGTAVTCYLQELEDKMCPISVTRSDLLYPSAMGVLPAGASRRLHQIICGTTA